MKRSRKRKRKGRPTAPLRRVYNFDESELLGAGGFGIAVSHRPYNAIKLLYDIDECVALREEARIQINARKLLENIVHVPRISHYMTEPVAWKGVQYLCGIVMERIRPAVGFNESVHMLLGYDQDDANQRWGNVIGKPISQENPSRGFFASADFMEAIWEDDSCSLTLQHVAETMGRALRALIDGGIVPNDLEWIYGGDKQIHLVDFGLCRFGAVDPMTFFFQKGSEGLASEIYLPTPSSVGYPEYYYGFFGEFPKVK